MVSRGMFKLVEFRLRSDVFGIERNVLGRLPVRDKPLYPERVGHGKFAYLHGVAFAQLARGFAVTAVHRHAVHAAGFGGIAARFEDSDRPQPLVYPYLLFHDVLYGMKTERAAGETSGKALCRGPSGYKGRKNFFRRARIFGCGRRTGLPFAAGGMPAAPSVAGTAGESAWGLEPLLPRYLSNKRD